MIKPKYGIAVQWSEVDQCYVVGFPDFPGQRWRTHGDTYEEAFMNAMDCLDSLIEAYRITGHSLPVPEVLIGGRCDRVEDTVRS